MKPPKPSETFMGFVLTNFLSETATSGVSRGKGEESKMAKHGALIAMENCIEQLAGKAVTARIMEDSEAITEKTDKTKIAHWVKGAMERLDALVDEKSRVQIMQNCGYNCAKKNSRVIERAVTRRKKFSSLDAFLEAELKKPLKGTRLAVEGAVLYQFYTPQAFTIPMRCYCGLLRGLPNDETVSKTYCNCSKGFVEKYWETVLQKPVKVDLLQSAISGAKECKFAIHL
jgi:predicted hydrocarbon binding protein